jgi:hypothetical protein
LEEEEASVFLKNGIRRATSFTHDIILDVTSQHGLYLFLLESTFDDQLTVTINRTVGTKFSKQIIQKMLRLSVQAGM